MQSLEQKTRAAQREVEIKTLQQIGMRQEANKYMLIIGNHSISSNERSQAQEKLNILLGNATRKTGCDYVILRSVYTDKKI